MAGFLALDSNELALTLADQPVTVYFTDTHIADLGVIIDVDLDDQDQYQRRQFLTHERFHDIFADREPGLPGAKPQASTPDAIIASIACPTRSAAASTSRSPTCA